MLSDFVFLKTEIILPLTNAFELSDSFGVVCTVVAPICLPAFCSQDPRPCA